MEAVLNTRLAYFEKDICNQMERYAAALADVDEPKVTHTIKCTVR